MAYTDLRTFVLNQVQTAIETEADTRTYETIYEAAKNGDNMIIKMRKKPLTCEVVQFTGTEENRTAIIDWVTASGTCPGFSVGPSMLCLTTNHGNMYVEVGEYIIKGAKGEFYPIKEEALKEYYERAR